MPAPALYLLLGYPGTGKYTVARELTRQLNGLGRETRLVDNHLVANPIFAITALGPDGALPAAVFPHLHGIKGLVLEAIEDLCPHDWSLVFTNYLQENEGNAAHVSRLAALAADRGNRFVPVVLSCDQEVLLSRVVAADRQARMKLTSPDLARRILDNDVVYRPPGTFTLDVTHLPPEDAARWIIER